MSHFLSFPPTRLFPPHTQNVARISRRVRSNIRSLCSAAVLHACCRVRKPSKVGQQNPKGRISHNASCRMEHVKGRRSALTLTLFANFGGFKNPIILNTSACLPGPQRRAAFCLGRRCFCSGLRKRSTREMPCERVLRAGDRGSASFGGDGILLEWPCCTAGK